MSSSAGITRAELEEMDRGELLGQLEALADRVDGLAAENQQMRDENEKLRNRVDQLEDDLEGERDTRGKEDAKIRRFINRQIEETEQKLFGEQDQRGHADAKLRRRIDEIAEEQGVEIDDDDIMRGDKIQRLIAHGPEAITDNPFKVHDRARKVLMNAGRWGTATNDGFGKRIIIDAPTVRDRLEEDENRSLQSKIIQDVFNKIVELAADSPRKAEITKNEERTNRLVIHLEGE